MKSACVIALVVVGFLLGLPAWIPTKEESTKQQIGANTKDNEVADNEQSNRRADEPAIVEQGPTYQGKPISHWIQQLDHKDSDIRRMAVSALADIGPEAAEAIPALVQLFRDKDEGVRREAVLALSKIGPNAIPALIEAHRDSEDMVAAEAAKALKLRGVRPASEG